MATTSALAGSWILPLWVCVAVPAATVPSPETPPNPNEAPSANDLAGESWSGWDRDVLLSAFVGGCLGAGIALSAVALWRFRSAKRGRTILVAGQHGGRHGAMACRDAACGLEELAREVEDRLDRKLDRLERLVEAADEYFGGGLARGRKRGREPSREAPIVAAPWKGKGDATEGDRSPGLSPPERRRTEVGGAASPPGNGRGGYDREGYDRSRSHRQKADPGGAAVRRDVIRPESGGEGAEGESRVGAIEITQEERELVLSLAAGGKSPETISDAVGLHRGEVDLILRLYGR